MFFWLRGEHALPKPRVACVSRLIGNSDSTGKATQWQVGHWGGTVFGNKSSELGTLARWAVRCRRERMLWRTKRHSWRSGVPKAASNLVLVTGLPVSWRAAIVSSASVAGFPAGSSLFLRAAPRRSLWGGCSAGYPVLIRLARYWLQQPSITGADNRAIGVPL